MTLTVIHERYPYRYVDVGILENGFPDYRIQKYNEHNQEHNQTINPQGAAAPGGRR